jgi:hypothetical protein
MVKYHFITFATPDHMSFAENNAKTALKTGRFDYVKIYTPDDIDVYYKFKNRNIFKYDRGYGCWAWKPYIIFKRLMEIEDGDILCYNDSKYLWLKDVRNYEADILINKNIGVYHNKPNGGTYIEKKLTKMDACVLMNIPLGDVRDQVMNTPQAWAGFILLRKSFNACAFIGEWLTYVQDERIVVDGGVIFRQNDPCFIESRHDQTVLSLLCKKWGIQMHTIDKKYMIDVRNPM